MPGDRIATVFPNLLLSGYQLTSPEDSAYNCVAWALGDTTRWWWPDDNSFWPVSDPDGAAAEASNTLAEFERVFSLCGFGRCGNDAALRPTHEKIAIFGDPAGSVTHVARQLPHGLWTSKIGIWEDIEHDTLAGIEGEVYGTVYLIMERLMQA